MLVWERGQEKEVEDHQRGGEACCSLLVFLAAWDAQPSCPKDKSRGPGRNPDGHEKHLDHH